MNKKIKKITSSYHNIAPPVKASIWFTVCSILQKGIGFITMPVFTRLMTTEQFGVYSVYMSWYSIIIIFATLNLSASVYINGMTKYGEDAERLTSSFLGLSTGVTAVLLILYLSNMNFWNRIFHLPSMIILVMFIQLFLEPAYQFWAAQERYNYKYKKIVCVTLIIAIGSPLMGIWAVLATDYKAEARILSYALVQILIGLIFYVYIMKRGKVFYHIIYWKYALAFNIPLIPHYLSQTALNQADRIMISNIIGTGEAAVYSIAYTVGMIMMLVVISINNSLVPYIYRELKENKIAGIRKNTNFLLLLVGFVCIEMMAFGPEVIWVVGGREYQDAIWVIPPIAASVYFIFLYPLFGNVEFYYEKTKFMMIGSCFSAALNILLNYIFIKLYGYYAAGYTTLICYILFAFVHYLYYRNLVRKKEIGGKGIYDIRFLSGCSLLVIVTMLVITLTYYHALLRYSINVLLLIFVILNRKKIIKGLKQIKNGDAG